MSNQTPSSAKQPAEKRVVGRNWGIEGPNMMSLSVAAMLFVSSLMSFMTINTEIGRIETVQHLSDRRYDAGYVDGLYRDRSIMIGVTMLMVAAFIMLLVSYLGTFRVAYVVETTKEEPSKKGDQSTPDAVPTTTPEQPVAVSPIQDS